MDLSRTRVVLRERSVVDILDLGLRFLVEHARVYGKTAGLVLPPFLVASVLVGRAGGWLLAWAFSLFMATFAGAPFTVLASRLVFEDDVRVFEAIKEGLRKLPRLLVLRVVVFVGGGLGFAMMVFPGIWFLTLTLFVVEVTVLERATVGGAVSRSQRIVRRESSAAVLALLLLALLHAAAVVAADTAGRTVVTVLLESRAPQAIWEDGWSTLGLVGFWLFVPYAATARFFVYLDIRTRSEGWDIQTRFAALAARSLADASGFA